MKLFKIKKSLVKKILIILVVIILFNYIYPTNTVHAGSWLVKAGGIILQEVLKVLIFLGDCVLDILQKNFISDTDVVIKASSSEGGANRISTGSILKIIFGILTILIAVTIAIASFRYIKLGRISSSSRKPKSNWRSSTNSSRRNCSCSMGNN